VSLILEALRKADAERERGSVPGLHAQPVPPVSVETAVRAPPRPLLWTALGAAFGLVVAVTWYLAARDPASPSAVPAAAAPADAPTGSAGPAPAAALPAPLAGLPPVAEPAPWPLPDARKAAEKSPAAKAAPGRTDAASQQPASAPAADAPVAGREALPEHIRAQLPALTFGGSIYSNNAASRSLIINGRIHRENDQVGPDLSLEQIKPKGAVLKFKGYRFEVLLY